MDVLGCIDADYVNTHNARETGEKVRQMMEACEHKEKVEEKAQKIQRRRQELAKR